MEKHVLRSLKQLNTRSTDRIESIMGKNILRKTIHQNYPDNYDLRYQMVAENVMNKDLFAVVDGCWL